MTPCPCRAALEKAIKLIEELIPYATNIRLEAIGIDEEMCSLRVALDSSCPSTPPEAGQQAKEILVQLATLECRVTTGRGYCYAHPNPGECEQADAKQEQIIITALTQAVHAERERILRIVESHEDRHGKDCVSEHCRGYGLAVETIATAIRQEADNGGA